MLPKCPADQAAEGSASLGRHDRHRRSGRDARRRRRDHRGPGTSKSCLLAGKSVNIKAYSGADRLLDFSPHHADFYLVFMGSHSAVARPRSFCFDIRSVCLFEIATLADRPTGRSITIAGSCRDRSPTDWVDGIEVRIEGHHVRLWDPGATGDADAAEQRLGHWFDSQLLAHSTLTGLATQAV